jgi:hypothetical protein
VNIEDQQANVGCLETVQKSKDALKKKFINTIRKMLAHLLEELQSDFGRFQIR